MAGKGNLAGRHKIGEPRYFSVPRLIILAITYFHPEGLSSAVRA